MDWFIKWKQYVHFDEIDNVCSLCNELIVYICITYCITIE